MLLDTWRCSKQCSSKHFEYLLEILFPLQVGLIDALQMKYKIKLKSSSVSIIKFRNTSKIPTGEKKHGSYTKSLSMHHAWNILFAWPWACLRRHHLSINIAYWKEAALVLGDVSSRIRSACPSAFPRKARMDRGEDQASGSCPPFQLCK